MDGRCVTCLVRQCSEAQREVRAFSWLEAELARLIHQCTKEITQFSYFQLYEGKEPTGRNRLCNVNEQLNSSMSQDSRHPVFTSCVHLLCMGKHPWSTRSN